MASNISEASGIPDATSNHNLIHVQYTCTMIHYNESSYMII